jgi:hypothetical protein
MRNPLVTFYILGAVLAAGCAPVPLATTYPIHRQLKMQSVAHWQLLAGDTAAALSSKGVTGAGKMLYLQEASMRSPFTEGFENYLIDSLRDKLRPVAVTRGHLAPSACDAGDECTMHDLSAAIYISYGVQRVEHARVGTERPPPGFFTLLGAGIWLGNQASTHWSAAHSYVAAVPAGAAIDLLSGAIATPTHTEVVVSIAVQDELGRTMLRQDRSYYVSDEDAFEYPNSPLMEASLVSGPIPSFRVGLAP